MLSLLNQLKNILDLCGGSGEWSRPYRESGYNVILIDLPKDVRLIEYDEFNNIYGILAAPPCTVFANSGARWPRTDSEMIEGLSVVDACLRLITLYKPRFWALENPVGKLTRYLGPPKFRFDPCDFGDPYTKRTYLWGNFNFPIKYPVDPIEGSKMHTTIRDPAKRAITPSGFARAFFEANP